MKNIKAKLRTVWTWIWNGLIVLAILAVALVCMALMESFADKHKDMSGVEKAAYAKGQYDAMQGDIRIKQVEEKKFKQTKSFIDGDDKFSEATFILTK